MFVQERNILNQYAKGFISQGTLVHLL